MTPRILRALLILASLATLAVFAACGDDDESGSQATPTQPPATSNPSTPTPEPTKPPAATPTTVPATATPSRVPTLPGGKTTGIPALDALAAIILTGDAKAMAAQVQYLELACDNVQGLGGPPECLAGEAKGTLVKVLPFAGCEGSYTRPAQVEAMFASQFKSAKLYSAFQQKDQGTATFPRGPIGIVFEIEPVAGQKAGVIIGTNDAGKIVNVWRGCGLLSPDELFASNKGATVYLQP